MTPLLSLIVLAIIFFTSFLSGILGMAGGMVLMGVLAWILPVRAAMVLHATSQFFANGSRAFFHREHIYRPGILPFCCGLGLALAVMTVATYVPEKQTLFLVLGLVPFIGYGLPKSMKMDFTRPWQAFACGAAVTFLHLTAGVSGPLLDTFFQNVPLSRHQTVATKACTQALSHAVKFIYFGFVVAGAKNAEPLNVPLWLFAAVVPVAVAGTHAARPVLDRLTDKQFYKATQGILFILGALYLGKALALM